MSALVFDYRFEGETHVIVMVGEGVMVIPRGATTHGAYATLAEAIEVVDSILPLLGVDRFGVVFV